MLAPEGQCRPTLAPQAHGAPNAGIAAARGTSRSSYRVTMRRSTDQHPCGRGPHMHSLHIAHRVTVTQDIGKFSVGDSGNHSPARLLPNFPATEMLARLTPVAGWAREYLGSRDSSETQRGWTGSHLLPSVTLASTSLNGVRAARVDWVVVTCPRPVPVAYWRWSAQHPLTAAWACWCPGLTVFCVCFWRVRAGRKYSRLGPFCSCQLVQWPIQASSIARFVGLLELRCRPYWRACAQWSLPLFERSLRAVLEESSLAVGVCCVVWPIEFRGSFCRHACQCMPHVLGSPFPRT